MTFYTGVGAPHWLNRSPVPLFLSAATLTRYRSRGDDFPVRNIGGGSWAGDSGAFSALTLTKRPDQHPWWWHPDEYGSMWVRLIEDIGPPDFVAVQDVPCEFKVRRRTGLTVHEHQELSLHSYLYLVEEFPMVPWIPILQGWMPWEYLEHAEMYERAGVRLADAHTVGVGSICRRGSQHDVATVLGTLAQLGLRLHGFGISINALRLAGHLLHSADSQAWSATSRYERLMLPGCTHLSRPDEVTGERTPTDCRNCFRYALAYREEVMEALRECDRARKPGPPTHARHLDIAERLTETTHRCHERKFTMSQIPLEGEPDLRSYDVILDGVSVA